MKAASALILADAIDFDVGRVHIQYSNWHSLKNPFAPVVVDIGLICINIINVRKILVRDRRVGYRASISVGSGSRDIAGLMIVASGFAGAAGVGSMPKSIGRRSMSLGRCNGRGTTFRSTTICIHDLWLAACTRSYRDIALTACVSRPHSGDNAKFS